MSRLNSSLGNTMWYQEEIKSAINNLRLFNETLVDIGSLWWILNVVVLGHMEESLSNSLVHNDKSVLGENGLLYFFAVDEGVLLMHDLVQLFEFMGNDLLSHGIADTISIDENVIG